MDDDLRILVLNHLGEFAEECWLADTCHDAGKDDYEYLPAKGWNGMKYTNKLKNMSRALADMGTDVLPLSLIHIC